MSQTTPNPSTSTPQPTPEGGAAPPAAPAAGAAGAAPAGGSLHSASLYVGDLAPDVTEAVLFELFNAVGPVASIRVCRDAVTRRSLGYAYVNFHQVGDAERALDTMNFSLIRGKPMRLMWSMRDPGLRKSSAGNVFVKNLHESIDNKALYDTFSLFGNILSCKVATDEEGNSKGYGYVHYETAEGAQEAIARVDKMLVAGQEVSVGPFQRRSERASTSTWTNCFVKNMPKQWDENKLREVFGAHGEITSACVTMKPATEDSPAESRCFGFVNFAEHEGAAAAVDALNGQTFEETDAEEPKELFVGRAQRRAERDRELRHKFEQLKVERINRTQGVNLYIKNLDDQVDDDLLRAEFAPHGTITSCRVMRDAETNASKGFGFVCFSTPEEATKAIAEMNNKIVMSKPMYVALAQRKEARRAQLEAQHAQRATGMARGMPMGQPHMYGAAPLFYAQAPGGMPPQRGNFVYPGAMMPRGPRGAMPAAAGYPRGAPAGYQMPPYAMPMQPAMPGQQPRGAPRGAPQGGRGQGQGGRGGQGQQNANGRYKYTANARNQPAREDGQAAAAGAPAAQQAAAQPAAVQPLTAASLAGASPEQQINMIGERLYPLVAAQQPKLAGKITGMLLEIDTPELLELLESSVALTAKIDEAVSVLEQHNAGADE